MNEQQAARRERALGAMDAAVQRVRRLETTRIRAVAQTLEVVTEYARDTAAHKAEAMLVVDMLRTLADYCDIEREIAKGDEP